MIISSLAVFVKLKNHLLPFFFHEYNLFMP